MTEKSKSSMYRTFLSVMLTVIIALLSFIGLDIEKKIDKLDSKLDTCPNIDYVDKQDDYLRALILESNTQMDRKLDLYIQQNNKIQSYILKN